GSGLFWESPSPATPQTIEHEMGHYMSLCALPNLGHSTGDVAGNQATRDDLVSRRRLMYPIVSLNSGAPSNWRDNTGYANLASGSFVTHRSLPAAQEISFGEPPCPRNAMAAPGFYAA